MATQTKLPTAGGKALIRDPDLAAGVEKILAPYNGKQLERAQAAVRKVRESGMLGSFSELLEAYRSAVRQSVGKEDGE